MKLQKPSLVTVSLLTSVSLLVGMPLLAPSALALVPSGNCPVDSVMDSPVFDQSVYAKGYVTLSATSQVNGDIWAGAAITAGAKAIVDGNSKAGAATTLGALVHVNGNVTSGAATTLGAGAVVEGSVMSGAATTYGAGSVVNNECIVNQPDPSELDVKAAQDALALLVPVSPAELLPGNLAADVTLSSGVHEVAGPLTVSASTIITLDAATGDEFIFNVSGYVSFGAGVIVEVINGTGNTKVIWNVTGTYISVGANAKITGTLMANVYVSTGAGSVVDGAYSATSYVTVGAGATVGAECEAEGGCATRCAPAESVHVRPGIGIGAANRQIPCTAQPF
ncbi:MAG: putative acyltransferase (DUF342 family) [Planctomycetota bacterium]|jgi:predicted acyltransferase (DUF342 family)